MNNRAMEFGEAVALRLAGDPEGVCRVLLPHGKRSGHEWEVDSVSGEPGDNLKIQLAPPDRALKWKNFETDEGGGIWKLWMAVRGCSWWEAVVQGAEFLNMPVPEIRSEKVRPAGSKGGLGDIVRTYDYTDAEGRLLHQTVRFEPKNFLQRRPAVEGQRQGSKVARRDRDGRWWLWTLQGIAPVLYRLPEVLAAEEVWLTEGEKDADALRASGVVATTCAMGAKKWKDGYSRALAGKRVILCGDSDSAGVEHLLLVGKRLSEAGADVLAVDWRDALGHQPENKTDAADFLEYGESKQ